MMGWHTIYLTYLSWDFDQRNILFVFIFVFVFFFIPSSCCCCYFLMWYGCVVMYKWIVKWVYMNLSMQRIGCCCCCGGAEYTHTRVNKRDDMKYCMCWVCELNNIYAIFAICTVYTRYAYDTLYVTQSIVYNAHSYIYVLASWM